MGKLLLGLCLLLHLPALGQRTIVGRVTDRATGQGLPDITVLLKGTSQGTTTAKDGTFSLTLTPADSSRVLVFSAINFMTVERLVADSVQVALAPGTVCLSYPDARITLISGVLHTPFGGQLQGYGHRFRLPLRATIGYQTNRRRNHQSTLRLDWLDVASSRLGSLSVGVRRDQVRNGRRGLAFTSHSLCTELDFYHSLPVLLLGAGRARYADERRTQQGYGYELGARHYFRPARLTAQATATRWLGRWQWQAEATRRFGRLDAGAALNVIGRYTELSLYTGITLY